MEPSDSLAGRPKMTVAALLDDSANFLIRRLSPAERKLLTIGAGRHSVELGQIVIRAGDRLDFLCFPETTLFSVADPLTRGEIAVVGREGFGGWSMLLGCTESSFLVTACTRRGTYLRIPRETVEAALTRSPALRTKLAPFIDSLTKQMARNGLSHAIDRNTVRVARWIMMRHDRVGGDELLVHHSEIADCLSVRRASVTDVLHVFEGDALLRCRRGRIIVRDAQRLSDIAGRPNCQKSPGPGPNFADTHNIGPDTDRLAF